MTSVRDQSPVDSCHLFIGNNTIVIFAMLFILLLTKHTFTNLPNTFCFPHTSVKYLILYFSPLRAITQSVVGIQFYALRWIEHDLRLSMQKFPLIMLECKLGCFVCWDGSHQLGIFIKIPHIFFRYQNGPYSGTDIFPIKYYIKCDYFVCMKLKLKKKIYFSFTRNMYYQLLIRKN